MFGALLEGFGYGMLLSILAGPIFFTIMQTGIERGSTAALVLAAGQWFSDCLYIFLVFWGSRYIGYLIDNDAVRNQFINYMSMGGAVLLAVMGLVMLFTRPPIGDQTRAAEGASYLALFVQGWLVNTVNPSPVFFWAALMSSALLAEYTMGETSALFASVMTTVVLTDMLKIYAAKRIKNWLKPSALLLVRRIAGGALLGFAALLLGRLLLGG